MKKIAYGIAVLLSLIVLTFGVLFIWRPVLMRVLRYQTPGANTYKIFPQSVVHPDSQPFSFTRAAKLRDDLDTIKVQDWQQKSVSFKDYMKNGKINFFMVIRNDTIIYQRSYNGYSDSTLTTLFSIAKSMVNIALGKALESGKISSLNDPLVKYVPELKSNPALAPLLLKDLLEMKSGLEFKDTNGGIINAFFSDEAKYYYTSDIKKELMQVKAEHPRGKVWKYKSIDVFLLTWALENATGQKISDYFQNEIWSKIGTRYAASFGLDHQDGLANTASRFQCTAIDLAKVGRLYLHKGNYAGKQIVPENWVAQSVKLNADTPSTSKGWQKTTQNYLWWLPQQGETGDFAAEGMSGQRLYIDPANNTIIVQLAFRGGGDYPYRKISRYLSGKPFSYPK